MGVLRREKRLLSVSLHSVKGHSFSFLPTALACSTYFSDNEEVSSFAFTSWTNSVKWDKLFKIGDLTYGVTIANVFCSFFGTICLHTYSGCILNFKLFTPAPLTFLNFLLTCCNWFEFKLPKNGMRCIIILLFFEINVKWKKSAHVSK